MASILPCAAVAVVPTAWLMVSVCEGRCILHVVEWACSPVRAPQNSLMLGFCIRPLPKPPVQLSPAFTAAPACRSVPTS